MMVQIYVHILFLALLVVSLQVSADDFADMFPKSITGETYLFVGEDLELNCSLSDSQLLTYTAHNITFKFQHKAQGVFKCVPQSHVSAVNSQVAMLVIQNVTSQNEGPYVCYVGSTDCKDGDNSNVEYVDVSEDVSVEFAPHNVTNFQCEVYNWDEYMICTWQHPVNYINLSNNEVTVKYMLSGHPYKAYKCPLPSKDNCTWNRDNVQLGNTYYIQVAVRNLENNATASEVFVVNTSQIVKPAPIQNFTITASKEKSGCLVLSWSHSDKYNEKEYRIKNNSKILQDVTVTDFTTCGYFPYTSHNFSVECRPTWLYSGYWSEPVYASIRTPMTAPELGPQTTNGSFTTTDCVDGSRSVTLMWQDVKEAVQNGLIDYYLIKTRNGSSINVSADMNSANVRLPCSQSQVEIFAHNEGGYSLKPTVLLIPPVTFTVPMDLKETFSVNVTRTTDPSEHWGTYRAMWQASDTTRNMNYTVFWCTGSPRKPCKGQLQWGQMITGTDTSYDIHLQDSDVENYIFGISVTDMETGMSSGIFWTTCIFSHNPFTSHPKAVEDLTVEADVEKAKIFWSKIQCTYQSLTKVTGYKVKWCKSGRCNDTDGVSFMDVPATENMYTASALTADVTYSFTVQPVSYEDVGDEVTPWVNAVPTVTENKAWFVPVLATVCVFVPLTLLGAVFFWACNARRDKIKQFKPAQFLTLTAADSRATTKETCFNSHLDTRGQATLRLLSAHSNNNLFERGCESRPDSPHHFQEMPTNLPIHQQNPDDPELLPSHSVSAQSYQHITCTPPDQLSESRNERQNEDTRMCQILAPPDSGAAQLTHSQLSQSSDLTHQDQESKPPSSGSIGPYQQFGNSPSSSSAESKNVSCQDERADQGLGRSNSGSLQPYLQIGNCSSSSSPEPKNVFCRDERTDQGLGLSNSESFQPYHQVAYCESYQPHILSVIRDANNQQMRVPSNSGPVQTDLSSMLGLADAYSPDTVIPSHHNSLSPLQNDNGNPVSKTINQSHSTGTCENVESHKPQSALTAGEHGIATPTTYSASAQQDHTTVDMDPSLAESEVNGSDAAPSDMSLLDMDAVLPEMQSNTDYVPHM